MRLVKNAKYEGDFRITLTFDNDEVLKVDLKDMLNGSIFEPLKDINEFKRFVISPELDTLSWPNGADFAPEFLYELALKQKKLFVAQNQP